MNDVDKMLKLMKFWLFGTFVIIFVAATVFVGASLKTGLLIMTQWRYWVAMLLAALICVAWYYIYKWYLNKKK